jgi:hypothetical protein
MAGVSDPTRLGRTGLTSPEVQGRDPMEICSPVFANISLKHHFCAWTDRLQLNSGRPRINRAIAGSEPGLS